MTALQDKVLRKMAARGRQIAQIPPIDEWLKAKRRAEQLMREESDE